MGKDLYLLRHAKSDWSTAGQKDFDRPLNDRGSLDAPRMGSEFFQRGIVPELIVASPAARTKATAEFIAEQLHYELDNIIFNPEVYDASTRSLMAVINQLSDDYNNVMIVGHNPSFTYLSEYLTKEALGNVPTCGLVHIHFETNSWEEISGQTGFLRLFIYPRMFWGGEEA